VSTSSGFCNCCGMAVELLTDVDLNESICTVFRSYDVTRDTIRNTPTKLTLHDIANAFADAVDELEVRA